MSKASKKAAKQKNLQKKRARKAANRARYDELRASGKNSKSKRFVKKSKKTRLAKTVSHPEGACGNIACKKCDLEGVHYDSIKP